MQREWLHARGQPNLFKSGTVIRKMSLKALALTTSHRSIGGLLSERSTPHLKSLSRFWLSSSSKGYR
jgi:hypothetical protein